MKNFKSKIRDFLNSEDGRVGVKTPLALGVATGGLMLAQVITNVPQADAIETCSVDDDCEIGETCEPRQIRVFGEYWSPTQQTWIPYSTWEWHDICVPE